MRTNFNTKRRGSKELTWFMGKNRCISRGRGKVGERGGGGWKREGEEMQLNIDLGYLGMSNSHKTMKKDKRCIVTYYSAAG